MEMVTKYITPDDFTQYFGIDLGAALKGNANPSDKAYAFLKQIEDRMETFLNANFRRCVDEEYANMTDYQKEHYRLALLEQAYYVFRNSDLSTDSGYDPDKGEIASSQTIRKLTIAPNAKDNLLLCGFWCTKINKHSRYRDFWGIW